MCALRNQPFSFQPSSTSRTSLNLLISLCDCTSGMQWPSAFPRCLAPPVNCSISSWMRTQPPRSALTQSRAPLGGIPRGAGQDVTKRVRPWVKAGTVGCERNWDKLSLKAKLVSFYSTHNYILKRKDFRRKFVLEKLVFKDFIWNKSTKESDSWRKCEERHKNFANK